ncbi:NAD(P)H-dependent glycerol-3-phosphate dehydrogenase [Brevibacillus choshinensis]|uniref:NAD(P)H-dependent glycerol-3-phosphate dehydrogenase n=1 Tax=Brevibacillus choshinensis TaxID=54911 RepID=UPI002E21BF6B|nr:NAD(P)H-dependent glycerol-3-phosphate dehydrogenase [Brevibacillus choshinensis]MED4581427.1 NAD(P)H-dependent glycerol-3-phosphate dehydrogenase [Brevibacillus choshinensis]
MIQNVAVIGAGSWGTALASVLADNGHQVTLWVRNAEQAESINSNHMNEKYLPDAKLSASIVATSDLNAAVTGKPVVLLAVPSHAMRQVCRDLAPMLAQDVLLLHAVKGFELESLKRMSEVMHEELPKSIATRLAVLSGPSHAEEVVRRQPTTVVVASESEDSMLHAQDLLMNGNFRVYTNPDLVGAEIAGALKNIIALGAGMSDGLGFGDNAKAALLTRGLAEISRLGLKLGALPPTFSGLAGIGDLVATCTSKHSRNWRAGFLLGQGKKLDDVLAEIGMVVEGVRTTQAANVIAKREDVEMPITHVLYGILFEGKDPRQGVEQLMGRLKTYEMEYLNPDHK